MSPLIYIKRKKARQYILCHILYKKEAEIKMYICICLSLKKKSIGKEKPETNKNGYL